jgi:hypothetical protein
MDFNLIIRDVAVNVAAAALSLAVSYLVLLLHKWNGYLKTKLNDEELDFVQRMGDFAVQAAEQSGLGKVIANEAKVKKGLAVTLLSQTLTKYGIKVTREQLDAILEEAVGRMNLEKQYALPPARVG